MQITQDTQGNPKVVFSRPRRIIKLAEKYNWIKTGKRRYESKPFSISFERFEGQQRINVNFYNKFLKVQTWLKHPKYGKTHLSRINLDFDDLEKILNDPRVHTDKGITKEDVNNRRLNKLFNTI